jgi:phosphate transport system protein
MTTRKEIEIQSILSDYEKLANVVLSQLDQVEKYIISGNLEFSEKDFEEMKKKERKINKLEVKLSDDIINAIALYQPVASEIRKLISCYRIIISLERIGDLTMGIVKDMKRIDNKEVYNSISGFLPKMMILSAEMARKSMLSFINQDMEIANWTIKSENKVDDLNHKMINKVIEKSEQFSNDKTILFSFVTIKELVASIERIADHAANIAEASYYSYEGKDIRHKRNSK